MFADRFGGGKEAPVMDDEQREILIARLHEWAKYRENQAQEMLRTYEANAPREKSEGEIVAEAARQHSLRWRKWEAKRDKAHSRQQRFLSSASNASPIARFALRVMAWRASGAVRKAQATLEGLRQQFHTPEPLRNISYPHSYEVDRVQQQIRSIKGGIEAHKWSFDDNYSSYPRKIERIRDEVATLRSAAKLLPKWPKLISLNDIPELPAADDPKRGSAFDKMKNLFSNGNFRRRVQDAEAGIVREPDPATLRALEIIQKLNKDSDKRDPLDKVQNPPAKKPHDPGPTRPR